MSTQAQNLSREMVLPAYKAAISPGPLPSLLYICREASTNSPFYAKQTQSCPPPADSKPFIPKRLMKIHEPFRPAKNKPKQTQFASTEYERNLRSDKGLQKMKLPPDAQKTNPIKPKQTQPVAAKPPCRGEVLHEAGMAKPDQTQPVVSLPNLFWKQKNVATFDRPTKRRIISLVNSISKTGGLV
ncbi:MAG TPA: hypothetical protein VMW16_15185 [Sedimentisphaerales bacterium]|nr:hypothetical protein [Sedimentisphaerales bacterium]